MRARRVVICIFYLFCTARATAQNSAILQILGGCHYKKYKLDATKKPPSRERGEWCDFANFKIFLYKKITNSVRLIKNHPHASAESGVFIILIEFYYFAQYVRLRRIVRFCKF